MQNPEERALAGSAGSDERARFALPEIERKRTEDLPLGIAGAQAANPDPRRRPSGGLGQMLSLAVSWRHLTISMPKLTSAAATMTRTVRGLLLSRPKKCHKWVEEIRIS